MMECKAYQDMATQQMDHWWFKGRRSIINFHLEKMQLKPETKILEIGCGTGGNLEMLSKFGELSAVEMDRFARQYAQSISMIDVAEGWLPDNLSIGEDLFDLICLFDVLEHIENDLSALKTVSDRLTCQGQIIITVPAGGWMYGKHDRLMHHYRRYNRRQLIKLFTEAGVRIEYITYFNTLLYPLAVIARVFDFISVGDKSTGSGLPMEWVNSLLYRVFSFERTLLNNNSLPLGLSLLCVGKFNERN